MSLINNVTINFSDIQIDVPEESDTSDKEKQDLESDEIYLMCNHIKWEDLVAWDNTHISRSPSKNKDLLSVSDKVSHYKGIQESIFKPTNRKLLDSNWENNIIWDTKNMKHLLKTPEVIVDPVSMLKIPIEKERSHDNKGSSTPKKVWPI